MGLSGSICSSFKRNSSLSAISNAMVSRVFTFNTSEYNNTTGAWEIPISNDEPIYGYRFDGVSDIAVVQDASMLNADNIATNPSFELFEGVPDSGTNCVIDGWANINEGVGTHTINTGANSPFEVKLVNNSTPAEIAQNIPVDEASEYAFHFKYRCNNLCRYEIYDNSNGGTITGVQNVASVSTSIYETQSILFTTPSGCESVKLRLITGASVGSYTTIDEVGVIKPYDLSVAFRLKRRYESVLEDRDYFISRLYSPNPVVVNDRCWSVRSIGDEDAANAGKLRFSVSQTLDSTNGGVYSTSIPLSGIWYDVVCTCRYNGGGASEFKIYVNGILESTITKSAYLVNSFAPLTMGGLLPVPYHPTNCDIADVCIDKRVFSQTDVDAFSNGGLVTPSTLTFSAKGLSASSWVDSSMGAVALPYGAELVKRNVPALRIVNNSCMSLNGIDNYGLFTTQINLGKSFYIEWTGTLNKSLSHVLGRNIESGDGIIYSSNTNKIYLILNGNANLGIDYTTDGLWHTYRVVRVQKNLEIFVDGVSIGTATTTDVYNVDTIIEQFAARRDTHILPYNGTISNLDINGSLYYFSECNSNVVYNVNGSNHITMYGTLSTIWSKSDLATPYNYNYGCDVWINNSDSSRLYVPLNNGTSIRGEVDAITGFTWNYKYPPIQSRSSFPHIESKIVSYVDEELIAVDDYLSTVPANKFFSVLSTEMKELSFTDWVGVYQNAIFAYIDSDNIYKVYVPKPDLLPLSVDDINYFKKLTNQL